MFQGNSTHTGAFHSLTLFGVFSYAQQITATLSGTTYDQSGAVVPNAQVVAKNVASGDTRTTVSNNDGYFTVTALQPATYDVTVTAQGFKTWTQRGVVLNQADSRTLPNIALTVGETSQQVEVVAGAEAVAPVDTGEVSTTLNNHMVTDIAIQGRDAGELLKIMPSVVATNGLTQGASFNDRVVSTNNGPVGALTADGAQPYGSMAYMLDGANLVDPGNMGTQIANINQDMTSEVKVLSNSYDAQYAKALSSSRRLARAAVRSSTAKDISMPATASLTPSTRTLRAKGNCLERALLLSRRQHRRPGSNSVDALQQEP